MITRDGLVAEYLFSGNADDTSGGGFHGSVNGATPCPDRFGARNSAYTFDGKDDYIKLYANGALNSSVRHRLAVHSEEPLYIGRKGTNEEFFYFNGAIDDIRIYNRALTEEEIQSLLV